MSQWIISRDKYSDSWGGVRLLPKGRKIKGSCLDLLHQCQTGCKACSAVVPFTNSAGICRNSITYTAKLHLFTRQWWEDCVWRHFQFLCTGIASQRLQASYCMPSCSLCRGTTDAKHNTPTACNIISDVFLSTVYWVPFFWEGGGNIIRNRTVRLL